MILMPQLVGAARQDASPGYGSVTDGLILRWSMDAADISGSVISDASGSGRDGEISGSPSSVTGVNGDTNGALSFSGGSVVNTIDVTGEFTVSVWVDIYTLAGNSWILSSSLLSSSSGWGIGKYSNIIRFYSGDANSRYVTGAVLTTGWHNIVAHYSPSSVKKVYLDGSYIAPAENNSSGISGTDFVVNGLPFTSGWTRFNGGIDDVRMYDRELSAAEVGLIASLHG